MGPEKDKIEDAQIKKVEPETKGTSGLKDTVPEKPHFIKKQEQLDELFDYLKKGQSYLVGVTTLSNGKLNHNILVNNFPEVDMLKSIKAHRDLVVNKLENL